MDCTKAFDTVKHSILFEKLIDAKIPKIIVRLIIILYKTQTADVLWEGHYSKEFSMKNGVKQGAILSPILFCFYMNNLFRIIKKERTGCFIGQYFAGLCGYVDDLFILSPSRKGLQEMLTTTENYANDHNIKFSTNPDPKKSKTKGIIFSNSNMKMEPEKLVLSGNNLPWIDGAKYLGNTVTNKINGLQNGIKSKRARYIEKNCELLQEFPFIYPEIMCKINSIYNRSFPGSVLWDFTSKNFKMAVNSWSVSVRHIWKLPINTHRYFIEPLGGIHAKSMLYCRFRKFVQSILKSDKKAAIYLLHKTLNDKRTITGKKCQHNS